MPELVECQAALEARGFTGAFQPARLIRAGHPSRR